MGFRTVVALYRAARVLLVTIWRVARQIFHETAGAIFFLFTVGGGVASWREWRHASAAWVVMLCLLFTGMMAAFSVTSFRDAGRVR